MLNYYETTLKIIFKPIRSDVTASRATDSAARRGAAVVRLMSVPATRQAAAISIFVSRERVDSAGTELVASFQIYVELISSL
ncbi:unnamed protein product, partial [Brenthis ino]